MPLTGNRKLELLVTYPLISQIIGADIFDTGNILMYEMLKGFGN